MIDRLLIWSAAAMPPLWVKRAAPRTRRHAYGSFSRLRGFAARLRLGRGLFARADTPKAAAWPPHSKEAEIPRTCGSLECLCRIAVVSLRKASDVIFFATSRREELDRIAELRESLAPNGAIWIVRPRGVASIRESDVMAAGKRAGLVDTKVVKFSETHTAEKLAIPVTKR